MLRESLLLLYACVVGFVSAGVAASFYKMVTLEDARFRLLGTSFPAAFTTFFFCAVTGPMIIMRHAVELARTERNAFVWFFAAVAVAGVWSCCSGVVVLKIVLSLRNGIA